MSEENTGPGRPSKLTPEVYSGVIALVRQGIKPPLALAQFDINPKLAERWRSMARKFPKSNYAGFWGAVRRARAQYACEFLKDWYTLGEKDWEERKALFLANFPEYAPQAAGIRLRMVEQVVTKALGRLADLESKTGPAGVAE